MVREVRISQFTSQPEIGWKRNTTMDSNSFDTVTRNLGTLDTVVSRRSALRSLVAGALTLAGGSAALEAEARRGKAKGKNKKTRKLQPGDFCRTGKQCRHISGDTICGRTGPFTDERVCCGGLDALCDETGQSGQRCCYGYLCASGRCIVV